MPSKDTQTAPLATIERRAFNLTNCEVRFADGGSGPAVFSGYAAVFNQLSVNLGGFREVIKPGTFRTAVDEVQDVRFLINHDPNLVLGRTKSATVTLFEDEIGLRVECSLPDTSYAKDLAISMERGDVDQMSFGFYTKRDAWPGKDEETGLPIRELLEADLFDVSVVTYPAYPDTTATVRSWIAEENPELLERAKRAQEELGNDLPQLDEIVSLDDEARARAAGARIEADHEECPGGWAVVWNFSNGMQSCHLTEEAAITQLEAITSGTFYDATPDDGEQADDLLPIPGTDGWYVPRSAFDDAVEMVKAAKTDDEERAGKAISASNQAKLAQAKELLDELLALGAAKEEEGLELDVDAIGLNSEPEGEGEVRETPEKPAGCSGFGDCACDTCFPPETPAERVALPDLEAFRAQLEERGWDYDDDYCLYILTQMLQLCSCFVMCADDDESATSQMIAGMMSQLGDAVAALTSASAETGNANRSDDDSGEQREQPAALVSERRRLALHELELGIDR